MIKRYGLAAFVSLVGLSLGGCSAIESVVWPLVTSSPDSTLPDVERATAAAASGLNLKDAPTLAPIDIDLPSVRRRSTSDTPTGRTLKDIRENLERAHSRTRREQGRLANVQKRATSNVQRYQGVSAAIQTRLEQGIDVNQPALVSQWYAAQGELDRMRADLNDLNAVATYFTADLSTVATLQARMPAASSANDRDKKSVESLTSELNETRTAMREALQILSQQINDETRFVASEQTRLASYSNDIQAGQLDAAPRAQGGDQPALVVIRFDNPDVDYEQPLFTAISAALNRLPDAKFELVAVSPVAEDVDAISEARKQSQVQAQNVLKSLTSFGLPPSRVSLSARTSPNAETNEVQVFVK
jgi:hypothetical protein